MLLLPLLIVLIYVSKKFWWILFRKNKQNLACHDEKWDLAWSLRWNCAFGSWNVVYSVRWNLGAAQASLRRCIVFSWLSCTCSVSEWAVVFLKASSSHSSILLSSMRSFLVLSLWLSCWSSSMRSVLDLSMWLSCQSIKMYLNWCIKLFFLYSGLDCVVSVSRDVLLLIRHCSVPELRFPLDAYHHELVLFKYFKSVDDDVAALFLSPDFLDFSHDFWVRKFPHAAGVGTACG